MKLNLQRTKPMSQINKKYLDILKQIDREHNDFGDLHRNSKTLVIDGLNTFIRSWSTAPNLNENGDHIGGIVGTLKSIGYAIRTINPTRVVIVFDGKGGSNSRKEIYSGYKSERGKNKIKMRLNRAASMEMTPEEEGASMKRQMTALGELLSVLPVTIMIYDGIEAISLVSKPAHEEDWHAFKSQGCSCLSLGLESYRLCVLGFLCVVNLNLLYLDILVASFCHQDVSGNT